MKNVLIIGCGLLGSSLLRKIHKKKLAKKIFVYESSKKNISNFSLVYTFGGSLCHSQEATNEILTHGIFHDMKFKRLYYKAYTFPKVI